MSIIDSNLYSTFSTTHYSARSLAVCTPHQHHWLTIHHLTLFPRFHWSRLPHDPLSHPLCCHCLQPVSHHHHCRELYHEDKAAEIQSWCASSIHITLLVGLLICHFLLNWKVLNRECVSEIRVSRNGCGIMNHGLCQFVYQCFHALQDIMIVLLTESFLTAPRSKYCCDNVIVTMTYSGTPL